MKTTILAIILAIMAGGKLTAQTKEVWMLGPMLHYNIGGEKNRWSFSLELAYWNYEKFPYSFDAAIEFEKQKIRLYSEVQTGIGLAGLAVGPLVEFRTKEFAIKAGFQGSIWANYFLGFDLRVRSTGGDTYFCPGTYFKMPLGIYGDSDGDSDDWDSDWDWD